MRQRISPRLFHGVFRGTLLAGTMIAGMVLLAVAGCDGGSGTAPDDAAPTGPRSAETERVRPARTGERAGGVVAATIRVAVVGEGSLAEAIRREWRVRTESELDVIELSLSAWRESLAADHNPIDWDVVIYPATDVGYLAERGWIRKAPSYVVGGDGDAAQGLAWDDFLSVPRASMMEWDSHLVAVPFGVFPYLCGIAGDGAGAEPRPMRWSDFHAVLRGESVPPGGTGESGRPLRFGQPLAEGWAACTLLARAAPYLRDAKWKSDLFALGSMTPRLASPPIEKALEELIADQAFAPRPLDLLTPAQLWSQFLGGELDIAIGMWPAPGDRSPVSDGRRWTWAPLPGSDQAYSFFESRWVERAGVEPVPLAGAIGQVGSVSTSSRHQRQAWNLLVQLTSPQWSPRISCAVPNHGPVRSSQLRQLDPWLPTGLDRQAISQLAKVLQRQWSARLYLPMLRIPNADQYLAALDRAVIACVLDEADVKGSLERADEEWRVLLARHGVSRQSDAYFRHLGLRP